MVQPWSSRKSACLREEGLAPCQQTKYFSSIFYQKTGFFQVTQVSKQKYLFFSFSFIYYILLPECSMMSVKTKDHSYRLWHFGFFMQFSIFAKFTQKYYTYERSWTLIQSDSVTLYLIIFARNTSWRNYWK